MAPQSGRFELLRHKSGLLEPGLLIDLGPDIMAASHMHGRPLSDVRYCLQTHPHADHLDLSHLLSRSPSYGVVGAPALEFYLNLKIHRIHPLEFFTVGPYSVMAFPANHAPGMGAMPYRIKAGGRAVFYGTDTATLFEQTWNYKGPATLPMPSYSAIQFMPY